MTWRLITIDSRYVSKAVAHKIIWGVALLTLIPLIYYIIYSGRIKDRLVRAKVMIVYMLLIIQGVIIIIHYGIIPRGHYINAFAAMTQSLFKFLFYAFIFFVLFHDAIKLTHQRLNKSVVIVMTTTFILSLFLIISIMTIGYLERIDNEHNHFGTSTAWTSMKASHFIISGILVCVGVVITRYVKFVMNERGHDMKIMKGRPLVALWIVILTSLINSTFELAIDLSLLIINPDDCYLVSTSDIFNMILWLLFRLSASNLWIWPSFYVFNPKFIIRKEKFQSKLNEEDSYDVYDEAKTLPSVVTTYSSIDSNPLQSGESGDLDYGSINCSANTQSSKKLVISELYRKKGK